MKTKYIYLFFGVPFIFILIITNPSELNHRDKVKFKINQLLQNNVGNNPLKAIGIIVGGLVTDKFVNSSVTSKNFVLFSLTQFSWNGDTKTIGFGILGNVYISNKVEENIIGSNKLSNRILIGEGERDGELSYFAKSKVSGLPFRGKLIQITNSSNNQIRAYEFEFYVEDIELAKEVEGSINKWVTLHFNEYENFLNSEEGSIFIVDKIIMR